MRLLLVFLLFILGCPQSETIEEKLHRHIKELNLSAALETLKEADWGLLELDHHLPEASTFGDLNQENHRREEAIRRAVSEAATNDFNKASYVLKNNELHQLKAALEDCSLENFKILITSESQHNPDLVVEKIQNTLHGLNSDFSQNLAASVKPRKEVSAVYSLGTGYISSNDDIIQKRLIDAFMAGYPKCEALRQNKIKEAKLRKIMADFDNRAKLKKLSRTDSQKVRSAFEQCNVDDFNNSFSEDQIELLYASLLNWPEKIGGNDSLHRWLAMEMARSINDMDLPRKDAIVAEFKKKQPQCHSIQYVADHSGTSIIAKRDAALKNKNWNELKKDLKKVHDACWIGIFSGTRIKKGERSNGFLCTVDNDVTIETVLEVLPEPNDDDLRSLNIELVRLLQSGKSLSEAVTTINAQ